MSEEESAAVLDLEQEFLAALGETDPVELRARLAGYLEMWVSGGKATPGLAFDSRTGLYDPEGLEREFERLTGEFETFAVVAVGIDFFDVLEDRLGREAGAEILASAASFVHAAAHEQDMCFRHGDAEFLVLSPGREGGSAFRLAERIRSNITARCYGFFGLQVTASLGISVYPTHATRLGPLLELARESMQRAEESGRDRAVLYEPDQPATLKPFRPAAGPGLNNLPVPATPFVGREGELAEAERRLTDAGCRLLTLTGPGGMGKTRLALEAAARLVHRFPFGVFMVSLDSPVTPDLLADCVADALGLSFYGPEDHLGQVLAFLQDKEALLLIDDFTASLPAPGLLAKVLAAAPGIKILATSRTRLELAGEWVMEVEGMACPAAEDATDEPEGFDAVRLFVQGARRVNPIFSVAPEDRQWMARICRLLGGSPLAIELASSWARLLSLPEIAGEIERDLDFLSTTRVDVPEKHRSMRAVFDYSWGMLEPREAACFSALSVFKGGFRREAAQVVAGANLLCLAALVDKSLVHRNPTGRYEAHGLVRQYAEEKLGADYALREKAHAAHCHFFSDFLNRREERLEGMLQRETLREIAEEIENIREAWNKAVEERLRREMDMALQSLYLYYDIRGWLQEGVDALSRAAGALREQLLEAGQERAAGDRLLLARIAARLGRFYRRLGDYRRAWDLEEESLAIFVSMDERREEAYSLLWLGNVAESRGDYRRAEEEYGKSLYLFRVLGDRRGIADALKDLGNVAHARGEYAAAREHYQESLDLYQDTGDLRGISATLNNLGVVAEYLGENVEAMRLYQESLAIDREIGEQVGIATSLINLGDVACGMGKLTEARKYFYEALKLSMRATAIPVAVEVLGGIARLLAWEGKREEAMELVSLVHAHPACDREDRDRAARLMIKLEAELPEPAAREAGQRGRSRLLNEVVAEILAH